MTTGLYPTSFVSHLPSLGAPNIPQGYYRSKLFIAPFSANILVAAAGPLFSLLERLCLSPSLPPIDTIRDNIEHELFAFHSKLNTSKYSSDVNHLAYYLMTATIDEILGKSYLRVYNEVAEFKAFTPLTPDGTQPQQLFFDILSHVKERPNQYLDLIELIYFSLIAGFEGKYHLKADGRQMLDNTIEDLYQIIQKYRFHKPYQLFHEHILPKSTKKDYKTAIVSSIIVVSLILGTFFTSQILLEHKAKTVLLAHSQLALLDE